LNGRAVLFAAADRGAHLADTEDGGKVDYETSQQVGRAMKELGVHTDPSTPAGTGGSERNFSTGRTIPRSCDCHDIRTWKRPQVLMAYIDEFNRRFQWFRSQRERHHILPELDLE